MIAPAEVLLVEDNPNDYIVKPVDFDQFVEAVRKLGCYWLRFNPPPKLEG
ncbi:MAG TPA: hypothetical protein VKU00_00080 [Chthonomonadaceae bacterium]|nr:hypothetical protein [Chthonomonadaceae bacterium]